MLIESSNAVITILTILILVLLFFVIKLNIQFYKDKRASKKKIKSLKAIFIHTNKNQFEQLEKIKLSEEIKNKLKIINTTLGLEIFELNRDLFEILSKNHLA